MSSALLRMLKALRGRTPREEHGHWKRPKTGPDPIDLLDSSNEGRLPQLSTMRSGKIKVQLDA
jgi:hypothetical protein